MKAYFLGIIAVSGLAYIVSPLCLGVSWAITIAIMLIWKKKA
ncbi:hypothetical protein [Ruminococcus flavefaciens]|nr:hypothetical protein [Ruminococcus flavefaciens]